jgi:peptide/nickel transport system substrate-binding protein
MITRVLCLALVTALAVIAVGSSAIARTPAQKSGGTFTYLVQVEGASLDPAKFAYGAGGGPSAAMFAIFGSLFIENPLKTGAVTPLMAKSVSTSDDGITWVIKLNPNVKFTDGTPLDAEAVVYNWSRIADVANRSRNFTDTLNFESYTATDPTTVTVVLKKQNTQFPHTLVQGFSYIGSPTAIKADPVAFGNAPVGAGPFKLDTWTRNSQMELSKNASWKSSPGPYIDKLVIKPIPDTTQRQNTYNSGAAQAEWSFKTDDVKKSGAGSSNILELPQLSGSGIGFNLSKAPFDDADVRTAVAMALDVPQITASIYPGEPSPAKPGNKDWRLFRPTAPWANAKATYPKQNLPAAQRLLDGYLQKTGQSSVEATFLYVGADPTQQLLVQLYKSQIEKLKGITLNLQGADTATLVTQIGTGGYQISTGALLGAYPDPYLYNTFYTGYLSNSYKYSNPQVDALLDDSRATDDQEKQFDDYKKIQPYLAKDLPYLPIRWSTYYLISQKSVTNVVPFANAELRVDLVKMKG